MKNRFLVGFIGLIIFISVISNICVLAENKNTADKAEYFISGIVSYQQSDKNIQNWIDTTLAENAGESAEWYVLALSQYGSYDFKSYEKNLLSYLSNHKVSSASSRLKYALCLSAIGSSDDYIEKTLTEAIGQQGIMSFVFGLHLLNNVSSDESAKDSVIQTILSMQFTDGGWAVTGEYGEVDTTAMTIQALAPYYQSNANVKDAIERALTFLSERQQSDGDYASYGICNPESTAQVLVALSSLGIDCNQDNRFMKNGKTLIDGIEKFQLSDGSFCHQIGKNSNATATMQVFYSMVSYLRMTQGKTSFYIFDNAKTSDVENSDTTIQNDTVTSSEQATQKSISYKVWVSIVIFCIGALITIILLIQKKKNIKNYLCIVCVTVGAIVLVCMTNIQTVDDYYNGDGINKENVTGCVTMSIRCDIIVDKSDSEYVPDDGVILKETEFDIEQGDTVYDILVEASKKYNIQFENEGSADMAYISGINYLYEFDYGELSGWVYHVNGVSPSVGCGEYELVDGDVIEWQYSCNLGEDVK